MSRLLIFSVVLSLGVAVGAHAQKSDDQSPSQTSAASQASTASGEASSGESSSKSTQVDLSPPPDDAKDHPDSAGAVNEAEEESGANTSVEEVHPWNPHKAMKDIEVGDFYFRQKNYKAALSRYQEALLYKPNDAVANFRSAQCFEELNSPQDAVEHYQAYLKVMPHGPFSRDAEKALAKLQGGPASAPPKSQ